MIGDGWGGLAGRFTRTAWVKSHMSVMETGCGVVCVRDIKELIEYVHMMVAWSKEPHAIGVKRPNQAPKNSWGERGNVHWGSWFLQGIPGVGADRAAAIIEHFGRVPVKLDVSVEELGRVPGLGPKTIEAIRKAVG